MGTTLAEYVAQHPQQEPERELEADSRERIKRAVKEHEKRIAELEALIAKGAESKAS